MFLSVFSCSELQQESIGQAVVKLASPNVIPPILFALAVEVDNLFGSRWLIDELYRLGFSVSYSEVTRFKQACAANKSSVLELLPEMNTDSFTQFIADNVDHNVATLDGQNTFHGIGIIDSTFCKGNFKITEAKIKRPSRLIKVEELLSISEAVQIRDYIPPAKSEFQAIKMKPIIELLFPYVLPRTMNDDIGWNLAGLFSGEEAPRPNWSGYMQLNTKGKDASACKFTFLPIINMNPSSPTCIYSTLLFIEDQCRQFGIDTPSVTFDQPLWLKATQIVKDNSMNTVVHLGGFHTLMSFVGSIGTLMDGSGISDALKTIYGDSTIKHIQSGKAIARALHDHFLVESAL